MDKKLIGLDLTHIADGGLQEKLDKELEKVFDNILDLNTDAKAKRKVTITLTMSANEERTVVDTTMEVKSKFAPQNGVATTILRMIEEYKQLKERTNKLSLMISNYYVGTLDFKLKCPIELLETQHYTMCVYLKILEQRAEIENIEF